MSEAAAWRRLPDGAPRGPIPMRVPRLGTISEKGTSYAGGVVCESCGKLPSSCTLEPPSAPGTAYLPVMCLSSHLARDQAR
jgi:hypothetical protein